MTGGSESRPLLLEIVCEEIPARAIRFAAEAFEAAVGRLLDGEGVRRGSGRHWGGSRRLAVRFSEVASGLPPRKDECLGPPARIAFEKDGTLTRAGEGFAKKNGVDPSSLKLIRTAKGEYAGFTREVKGRTLLEILQDHLPTAVASLPFPKTMRWGKGDHRWVRPVHAVVALHGDEALPIRLFDVIGGRESLGHRFLAPGKVSIEHAEAYEESLRNACVLVDSSARKQAIEDQLNEAAGRLGVEWVRDDALLDEVTDLAEWPGVVAGTFDPEFLALPDELLVTTLRHHQKSFTVRRRGGLFAGFLAIANTRSDPEGHIRRGNEWVVSGRLEDAKFFWVEDRRRALESRRDDLQHVTFHAALGTYAAKSRRIEECSRRLVSRLGIQESEARTAELAAGLCKADLTTSLVGEFPELQGIVGGLLLAAEGNETEAARAIYEHYRPVSADDALPECLAGSVVAVADRLDTLGGLLGSGEKPTGSRDPFGLRRAANAVFRIVLARRWGLSLTDLEDLAGGGEATRLFLSERIENFFKDSGSTANEVNAIVRAESGHAIVRRPLPDLEDRLVALREIRWRDDFAHLVDLVKRVANIRKRNADWVQRSREWTGSREDPEPAVKGLDSALGRVRERLTGEVETGNYRAVVDILASLVEPVDRFFDRALVINAEDPDSTFRRLRFLEDLESILTIYFDLRELPGAVDRSG